MERIEIIEKFFIKQLDRERNIRVYLPKDYDESDEHYPVIYMHDGQNLFFEKESSCGHAWRVQEIMDKFYDERNLKTIIVGIDSDEKTRYGEYSPFQNEEMRLLMPALQNNKKAGGEGALYGEFIVNSLKPYIDKNYRTLKDRENTVIAGSSMGGLISLYIGLKYQNIFSKIGAFSSALYFAKEDLEKFLKTIKKTEEMKIYMDVGTKETSDKNNPNFPEIYVDVNKYFYKLIKENLFNGEDKNIKFIVEEGGVHNEDAWGRRFPIMIDFIF